MDNKDKSDKDFAALPREQQFLELVRRKLRKANKKMQRITALEASLASSKAKVNEEQKQLLASKDTTSLLVKEFSDLQTQMLKLIDEKKEVQPAATTPVTEEKKERPLRKKKAAASANASTPSTESPAVGEALTQDTPVVQATSSDSTQQSAESSTQSTDQAAQPSTSQPQDGVSSNQRGERPPKPKREWEFQKDIYLAQFKQTFTAEHDGKFVAVAKGALIGPFDTQEELVQAVGGGDRKDPSVYLAQIGNEDKNPIKRSSSGRRSGPRGDRGDRNGGEGRGRRDGAPRDGAPRDGANRAPRDPNQQRSNSGFSNPRRGGSGTARGGNQSAQQNQS